MCYWWFFSRRKADSLSVRAVPGFIICIVFWCLLRSSLGGCPHVQAAEQKEQASAAKSQAQV